MVYYRRAWSCLPLAAQRVSMHHVVAVLGGLALLVMLVMLSAIVPTVEDPWSRIRDECPGGTVRLYNGICQSNSWPPKDTVVVDHIDPLGATLADQVFRPPPRRPPYLTPHGVPPVIDISVGRQLFVDDFLIVAADGVERVEHKGVITKHAFLSAEKLWAESWAKVDKTSIPKVVWWKLRHNFSPYPGGLHWDSKVDRWRIWFRCLVGTEICHSWTEAPLTAESFWHDTKSVLKVTNADNCYYDVHTFHIDETPGAPSRYTALLYEWCGVRPVGRTPATQLHMLRSNDGMVWKSDGKTGLVLDASTVGYNPFLKKWIYSLKQNYYRFTGIVRYWEADTLATRDAQWLDDSLCQQPVANGATPVESTDTDFWHAHLACRSSVEDSPVLWIAGDSSDRGYSEGRHPDTYMVAVQPYESVMVVLLKNMLMNTKPKNLQVFAAFSRDGFHISKPVDRQVGVFAPSSPDETLLAIPKRYRQILFINSAPRFVGNSMRFLFLTTDFARRVSVPSKRAKDCCKVLHEWRRDGLRA
jgi:hypothetical protein